MYYLLTKRFKEQEESWLRPGNNSRRFQVMATKHYFRNFCRGKKDKDKNRN